MWEDENVVKNIKPFKGLIKTLVIIFIALVAFVILFNSVVISVQENEYALIKQFNKVERIIDKPGMAFKIPFIQSKSSLPKTKMLYDLASSDVITKDKHSMVVDNYVLWEISDPMKFIKTLNTIGEAERRINTVVYNATKTEIGNLNQNDIIEGRTSDIMGNVNANIKKSLAEYGINLVEHEIKRFDLPSDNKSSIYARMISERNQIAASYEAEGKEEATKIKNETDKEVSIILSEANATAEQTKAAGEAEYMRILSDAYNDANKADFYTYLRSLDAVKASMKGSNKTLFLPIDSPLTEIFID